MPHAAYPDEAAIREIVERFESCRYTPEEFTHARHLTVACWLLCSMTHEQALPHMREDLLRFTAHHGKQGYHETITRFWMGLLASFLRQLPGTMTTLQKVNAVVETFPSKDVLFQYYTRERVMSEVARRQWIEPDLAPLDGMADLLPEGCA